LHINIVGAKLSETFKITWAVAYMAASLLTPNAPPAGGCSTLSSLREKRVKKLKKISFLNKIGKCERKR